VIADLLAIIGVALVVAGVGGLAVTLVGTWLARNRRLPPR
jgi:hypothetical protein